MGEATVRRLEAEAEAGTPWLDEKMRWAVAALSEVRIVDRTTTPPMLRTVPDDD